MYNIIIQAPNFVGIHMYNSHFAQTLMRICRLRHPDLPIKIYTLCTFCSYTKLEGFLLKYSLMPLILPYVGWASPCHTLLLVYKWLSLYKYVCCMKPTGYITWSTVYRTNMYRQITVSSWHSNWDKYMYRHIHILFLYFISLLDSWLATLASAFCRRLKISCVIGLLCICMATLRP